MSQGNLLPRDLLGLKKHKHVSGWQFKMKKLNRKPRPLPVDLLHTDDTDLSPAGALQPKPVAYHRKLSRTVGGGGGGGGMQPSGYHTKLVDDNVKRSVIHDLLYISRNASTLHYLATVTFQEEDKPLLDGIVKSFVEYGNNINRTISHYLQSVIVICNSTALIAATSQGNEFLVESLIKHGARKDIRDANGLTAFHWAIYTDNLNCLNILIYKTTENGMENLEQMKDLISTYSLLHEAVQSGRTDIVKYLVLNDLCDVNQAAVRSNGVALSALELAVNLKHIPILSFLLTIPYVHLGGYRQHQLDILIGDNISALKHLRCLLNDKIGNRWTLHCLPYSSFSDKMLIPSTIKVINHYVQSGWNIDSASGATLMTMNLWGVENPQIFNYTLLHLASFYQSQQIIEKLVELGADVNCKTSGDVEVTPLHIAILDDQWVNALYLLKNGADFNSTVNFNKSPTESVVPGLKVIGNVSCTELLLRMGQDEGLPVLDAILKQRVEGILTCPAINELRIAIEEENPTYFLKLMSYYSKIVWNGDPTYLNCIIRTHPISQRGMEPPVSSWLQDSSDWFAFEEYTLLHLACVRKNPDIIRTLVEYGADVNLMTRGSAEFDALQILLFAKQWDLAEYLVRHGADVGNVARFNTEPPPFKEINRSLDFIFGDFNTIVDVTEVTTLQVLIHLSSGCNIGVFVSEFLLNPIDEKMLALAKVGLKEYHIALYTGSPRSLLKILKFCVQNMTRDEFLWLQDEEEGYDGTGIIKVPAFHMFFTLEVEHTSHKCRHVNYYALNWLLTLYGEHNYDFNIVAMGIESELNFGTPVLFYGVIMDFEERKHLLLNTLLNHDHLNLNLRDPLGRNVVEFLIDYWHDQCIHPKKKKCWEKKYTSAFTSSLIETIQILISYGIDLSGVVITERFFYHDGYLRILKLLCMGGAEVTPKFLSATQACHRELRESATFKWDMEHFTGWKEGFDIQIKHSEEHRNRLRVRKSLTTVGDVKRYKADLDDQMRIQIFDWYTWFDRH